MLEVTPSSISITHSSQSQTRHVILRNSSITQFAQIVLLPPKIVPCVKIQKPDKLTTDIKPPRIGMRLPPGDRVVLKVLYNPEKKEKHIYEDVLVVFSDLNDRPILVNVTCTPLGTLPVGSKVRSDFLANLQWPEEIRPATSTSTKNLDCDISHLNSDEDSLDSEPVSFLESKGWINDAGESVKSTSRRRPPTATNGASKRQLEDNWEALKRSYRQTNFTCFVV